MPTPTQYQQTQVMTASPMELIIMMYDECITTLDRADKAFELEGGDRIQALNNTVLHAEDIIAELAVSLDMEKGGEIAKNLHRLYDFMIYHLSQGNINQNRKCIADVRKMMAEMREAWQKVYEHECETGRAEPEQASTGRSSICVNG